jgi:Tfp pilus assembly PilM family ATPase
VWISGGVARLPGIADRFRASLGVPVHLFDPLAAFPVTCDAPLPFAPALAVAAGLALENLTLAPVHP